MGKILEFCKRYNKKTKEATPKKDSIYPSYMLTEGRTSQKTTIFSLTVEDHDPDYIRIGQSGENLFELDQEDLDYLYHKYSKLLEKELQSEIDEIRKKYKKL